MWLSTPAEVIPQDRINGREGQFGIAHFLEILSNAMRGLAKSNQFRWLLETEPFSAARRFTVALERQPDASPQQRFCDRTSGKRMTNILRQSGFVFQTIYAVYPDNSHARVLDPEWIKKCGENNWIVVIGDKRIETVPENRQAVVDAKVIVFLLNDSNSKPEVRAPLAIYAMTRSSTVEPRTAKSKPTNSVCVLIGFAPCSGPARPIRSARMKSWGG